MKRRSTSSVAAVLLLYAADKLDPAVSLSSQAARPAFRAAVYQGVSRPKNILFNLKRATDAIRRASDHNVELIVFPELFLQGYDCPELGKHAVDRESSDLNVLGHLSKEFGVACVMPYGEKPHQSERKVPSIDEGSNKPEKVAVAYSSAAVFHADGTLAGSYRKTNLVPGGWESATFLKGHQLIEAVPISVNLKSVQNLRCGIVMSYDAQSSPEQCRHLVRSGAELLLVSGSLDAGRAVNGRVAKHLLPARALENGVHVMCANYEGRTESTSKCGIDGFIGLSGIFAPDGEELIRAPLADFVLDENVEHVGEGERGRVVTGVPGSSIIPCEDGELYVSNIELDLGNDEGIRQCIEQSTSQWQILPTIEEKKSSSKGFGKVNPTSKRTNKPRAGKHRP